MCFSATASFTTAGILSFVGSRSLFIASREQKPYALIPLLFAMQQTMEGMVWITLESSYNAAIYFARLFLVYAFVVWPIWVPLAVGALEPNKIRQKFLKALGIIGHLYAFAAAVVIFGFPVQAAVAHHSIAYDIALPVWAKNLMLIVYLFPTILSWFISSHKLLNLFGGIIVAAMAIAYASWAYAFTSVWCFFAALLSICIWASLEFRLLRTS